jgi:hypothetical protein
MMRYSFPVWRFVLFLAVSTMPAVASAEVYVSEVAWMGRADNANAEWIELHNTGEAQNMEGWTLVAKDGQPAITLSGSIGSGAYALLERTSDETVPGVSALVIYTGAMGNSGEVLELRDARGVVVDVVDGSSDWAIGGDNTTKDTLQRTSGSAGGAWTTAPQTPQSATVSTNSARKEQGKDTANTSNLQVLTGSEESPRIDIPKVTLDPALTLDIGAEVVTTVGAPVRFVARAYKEGGREVLLDDVQWTFGDGAQGTGRTTRHAYVYEGEYVVYAKGNRSGLYEGVSDTARMVVRVVPASLRITDATLSYVEVENVGEDELDISGYFVASGEDYYRFPSGTYILPRAHVRFPSSVTAVTPYPDMVTVLYSPARVPVAQYPSLVLASAPKETSNSVRTVAVKTSPEPAVYTTPAPSSDSVPVVEVVSETTPNVTPARIMTDLAHVGGSVQGGGAVHARLICGWWVGVVDTWGAWHHVTCSSCGTLGS